MILAGVDDREVGSASGTLNAVQQLGNSIGVAVLATIFFSLTDHGHVVAGGDQDHRVDLGGAVRAGVGAVVPAAARGPDGGGPLGGGVAHALGARVDVDAAAAREAAERHAAVGGELDGQRRRRADADEDRRAGDGGLLHELEREPPADAQQPACSGSAPSSSARPTTLSIALWRPTSSRTQQQLAGGVEEAGRVQAAGALEAGLAQALGQAGEQRAVDDRARRAAARACTATSSSAPLPQTPHDDVV